MKVSFIDIRGEG